MLCHSPAPDVGPDMETHVDKHNFLLKRRRRFNQQSAIPWKSLFDVSRTCLNEFDYEWRRVPRLSFKNQSGLLVSDVPRPCLREHAHGTSLQLRPLGHGNKPVGISSSNSFTNTTDARTSRSIKINKQRNGFLSYLGDLRRWTDHMLVVDVDVVGSGADRQRLLLQLLAVPADQLIAQLHVFRQSARSNVAHLAQLDDVAFLLTIEWHENGIPRGVFRSRLPFPRSSSKWKIHTRPLWTCRRARVPCCPSPPSICRRWHLREAAAAPESASWTRTSSSSLKNCCLRKEEGGEMVTEPSIGVHFSLIAIRST